MPAASLHDYALIHQRNDSNWQVGLATQPSIQYQVGIWDDFGTLLHANMLGRVHSQQHKFVQYLAPESTGEPPCTWQMHVLVTC